MSLPTSKKDLNMERSSACKETGKGPKPPLVNNDEPEEQQHTCVKQIFCIDATIVAYLNFSIILASIPPGMTCLK